MMNSRLLLLPLMMATAALITGAASAQSFTVRPIGPIRMHVSSSAHDINDKGVVIGSSATINATEVRGMYSEPPYTSPGSISVPSGFDKTYAYAINNHGVIAGEADSGGQDYGLGWYRGLNVLILPQGETLATARDVNDFGVIVGLTGTLGFVYERNAISELQPLNDFNLCGAAAINNSGVIVGSCISTNQILQRATRWINGSPDELQVLSGNDSIANDIADNGTIVGQSETVGGSKHAFIINESGVTMNLGVLAGDTLSEAYGTNGTDAVGYSYNQTDGYRATLFRGGEVINLNDEIPQGSGWELDRAQAININGQICGYGTFMGEARGFLLTPIIPTGGAADWVFTERQNGWTAVTNIPPYEPVEAEWLPGLGYGIRATGFPGFGFLQSPEVPLRSGHTYRLWVVVANTAMGADAAPQFRLRAFQTGNNQASILALDSVSDAIPSNDANTFEFSFTPLSSDSQATYRFNLDFTYFNPEDEQNAWVYLQRLLLVEE